MGWGQPGLEAENKTPVVLALSSRWARALVQTASSAPRGKPPTAEVLCLDIYCVLGPVQGGMTGLCPPYHVLRERQA